MYSLRRDDRVSSVCLFLLSPRALFGFVPVMLDEASDYVDASGAVHRRLPSQAFRA